MATRKYELRKRAERQEETRRRIAAATADLHQEVGPARTTVAEVARRAGVQRLTVYNNFPEDYDLLAACNAHFLEGHPPPDAGPAMAAEDPAERLDAVLRAFYGWYRETRTMAENVQRDRSLVPALDRLMSETVDPQLAELGGALARGFAARPARPLRAAVALALDFWTWRRLADSGLSDREAAALMVPAVAAAAV